MRRETATRSSLGRNTQYRPGKLILVVPWGFFLPTPSRRTWMITAWPGRSTFCMGTGPFQGSNPLAINMASLISCWDKNRDCRSPTSTNAAPIPGRTVSTLPL